MLIEDLSGMRKSLAIDIMMNLGIMEGEDFKNEVPVEKYKSINDIEIQNLLASFSELKSLGELIRS